MGGGTRVHKPRKCKVYGLDSHYGDNLQLATVPKDDGKVVEEERKRLKPPDNIPMSKEQFEKSMPAVEIEWKDRLLTLHGPTKVQDNDADEAPLDRAVKQALGNGQWAELQYFIHAYGGTSGEARRKFCNRLDNFGCPMLIRAVILKEYKVAEVLLFHGANTDLQNKQQE